MRIQLHEFDIPDNIKFSNAIAIDTEAMGLNWHRDRLCLVQITDNAQDVHLVHFPESSFKNSPNLKNLLCDNSKEKIFHYARFDVGLLQFSFDIKIKNIFCTKVASHLCRTYTNKHGLKDLCKELLGIELSKQEQLTDWGCLNLTKEQKHYAATDVIYLHALKIKLQELLKREKRDTLAQAIFDFLPFRCELDAIAGEKSDPMAHKMESL